MVIKQTIVEKNMALVAFRCSVCGAPNEYDVPIGVHDCQCQKCNVIFTVTFDCHLTPADKFYRDPKWLRTEYLDNGRTMGDIAKDFSVSPMTICHWLKRHQIKTRSRGRKSLLD